MDCCNYKELLDSYLCQELAVKTNHQMLNHAEHCPPCRTELALRRNMREALRRACSKERMSDEAYERLRSRLRSEASLTNASAKELWISWRDRLAELFSFRILMPVSTAILVLVIGVSFFQEDFFPQDQAALSESLITEAADDHRKCASHFISSTDPAAMPDSVREYDETCLELDKVASPGAAGLTLRAAHVCQPDSRKFAHLVYTRGENLISLLVTKRDSRALKIGEPIPFDANLAGIRKVKHQELELGAYQTPKHIILVVSDLPKSENEKLAQTLAKLVVEHIRRLDDQTASILKTKAQNLIASARNSELNSELK